jgi:hypothetical protein
MICEDVRAAMGAGETCEEVEGSARVLTHCLYPSFEPVVLYVSKLGDGYRISDNGGAVRSAWKHGRDESLSGRFLTREAARYHLTVSGASLIAEVPSIEWLRAGILAVANASAAVSHAALGKVAAAVEKVLRDRIYDTLVRAAPAAEIATDVEVVGASGDKRHFDYGVRMGGDHSLVLSAVAPHHSSIYAKYVAFADTKELDHGLSRFAVYERPLDSGDMSLMMQVADLVPLKALTPRAQRALAVHG